MSQDDSKRIPKYLLVQRYRSSDTEGNPKWVYLNETFDALDDALDRMNWTKNGKYTAANTLGEDYFIGLWELRPDSLVPVSSERIEKVEHRIVEHRSERVVWTCAAPQPSPAQEEHSNG